MDDGCEVIYSGNVNVFENGTLSPRTLTVTQNGDLFYFFEGN